MRCPQCGEETPEDGWNCVSCRINLYWASKHHDDLAELREKKGLPRVAPSPPFLIQAHKDAAEARIESGGQVEGKARSVARRSLDNQS
jgi:hypothetical protein